MSFPPNHKITAEQAIRYLEEQHGISVSRQTIHNWRKRGRQGTHLKMVPIGTAYFTTTGWLDEFLRYVNRNKLK